MRQYQSFSVVLALILIIAGTMWWSFDRLDTLSRNQTHDALKTVLESTAEAMDGWGVYHLREAFTVAKSTQMLAMVEAQLALPRDQKVLLAGQAQSKLRRFIRPTIREHDYLGFSVIAPDGTNIASSFEADVGQPNILVGHRTYLDRVFEGRALTTTPLTFGESGNVAEGQPIIFALAPIHSASGRVIAALALSIDPVKTFTRITRPGRLGQTGETYAFDKNGRLLTESRFDKTLSRIGLIKAEEPSSLNIKLRDPGGDMVKGFQPTIPRDQQPLTRMAAEAVAGRSGVDTDGYRDYRGVEVVGAWLWDEELGFGLATEQDTAEAFKTLRSIRILVLSSLVIIGIVFVSVALLLTRSRKKAVALAADLTNAVNRQKIEIAERIRVEEALKQSEARYALAQQAAKIGSWEWNILTNDLHWSDRIEPMFGFAPGQFDKTYQAFLDCVHSEDLQLILDSVRSSLEGQKHYAVEHRIVWPDGQVRWMAESGDVQRDEQGHPVRMYGVVQDISKRKELELLQEDVERIMRHDLKTPLNGVIALPEMMLENANLTSVQKKDLRLIQKAGYRMLNQINLSLDLYKMETGAFQYEPKSVESTGLLKRLGQSLSFKAGDKRVGLEILVNGIPLDKADSFLFQGDEALCHTMLSNILDNAMEASHMGERVSLCLEEEPDAMVFSVHNAGIVAEALRHRFFDKYATHGKEQGTGLGTYSAKLTAEAMGGSIDFTSSEAEGTTVTIRLPKG